MPGTSHRERPASATSLLGKRVQPPDEDRQAPPEAGKPRALCSLDLREERFFRVSFSGAPQVHSGLLPRKVGYFAPHLSTLNG